MLTSAKSPAVRATVMLRDRGTLVRLFRDLHWIVFLVWTAVGFVVMPLGLDETRLGAWLGGKSSDFGASVLAFLRMSDAVWICLAATVVYLSTAVAEGLRLTRIWAGIILLSAALFEWIGATTGFPFGPYVYTDRFGLRIGDVLPFTIPLAWFIILLGSRALVLQLRPAAARLELALGVALLGLLTDLNLELIAWKERGYWLWHPAAAAAGQPVPSWPPLQNFLSWFVLFFLLTCALPASAGSQLHRPAWSGRRSIAVFLLMNTLFLLTNIARWWRGSP